MRVGRAPQGASPRCFYAEPQRVGSKFRSFMLRPRQPLNTQTAMYMNIYASLK